ncbi:hypothetical protein ACFE04_015067 [Oxalis oulophora]
MVFGVHFLPRKIKRSPSTSKGGDGGVVKNDASSINKEIEWEVRPGGMLVQKRVVAVAVAAEAEAEDSSSRSLVMIKIKVSHGLCHHDVTLPAQSTFGDLKRVLENTTCLEPKEQRLLFRGKERDDDEYLHMVGVTDMSKVILLEDPASRERKLQEVKQTRVMPKAYDAIAHVRVKVDKLSQKVAGLTSIVHSGTKFANSEYVLLTELLMTQLLKLDAIEGDGEVKLQRRIEVCRVQSFLETLDHLKARNSNEFGTSSNGVLMTTE